MASREARRIRDRLTGKVKKNETEGRKLSKLTLPSIIIIGLVLIGLLYVGQMTDSGHVSVTFGAYEGRPIVWAPGNYFARRVAEFQESANSSGQRIDAEAAVRALLPYMIFHTAALVTAEKNGLTVPDAEVEEYIKSSGFLERYNKAEALERHDLFQVFKEQLIELKLLQTLVQSYENKALQDSAASMGAVEKKFKYVQWKYDDYPMQEIVKFATENKDLFRRIKLSRIAAKTEREAKDAYDKIISRQSTFDDQVRAMPRAEGEGSTELDWQSYHSLESIIGNKETTDRIFALKQGEISEVVTLGGQWLIYRCDREAEAADVSSETAINEIKAYILESQKGRVESHFETEAEKFLEHARKNGLSSAAAGAKLKLYETGYFPINYNDVPFLKTIPDMKDPTTSIGNAQSESVFFREAFALKKGGLSKPILLRDLLIICEWADERTLPGEELEETKTNFRFAANRDALNFFYFIYDHLYVRGMPFIFTGQQMLNPEPLEFHQYVSGGLNPQQVMFDASKVDLETNPATSVFYRQFVGDLSEKMGPLADRQEQIAAGFDAYRKLFSPQE